MEIELFTTSNIMFVLGLLGMIFSVYHYFKNPQIKLEKRQALSQLEDEKDKQISEKELHLAQKESENKTNLLEQQVKLEKEVNDKKFIEFGNRLDASLAMAQNHIHTVDTKVDALTTMVNTMNLNLTNEITKLGTIIEERIPCKKSK